MTTLARISTRSLVAAACLTALSLAAPAPAEDAQHGPAILHEIERARTRADHERLARHFDGQAAELRGKAREHEALARAYAKQDSGVNDGIWQRHCVSLAAKLRAAAEESAVLAAMHRKVAASAPEKP